MVAESFQSYLQEVVYFNASTLDWDRILSDLTVA